jgi:hypothetical protein
VIDLREGDKPDMRYEIAELLNKNPSAVYMIGIWPDKMDVVISANINLSALAEALRNLANEYETRDRRLNG